MASDVNFSLVSALSDLSPARRAEPRAAEAVAASAQDNAEAGNASFNRLVSDEAATARAASQARSRSVSQRAERSMPGRVTQPERREAPESPAPSEKSVGREPTGQVEKPCAEDAANRKPATCVGPAGDQTDTPVEPCVPKAPDEPGDDHVICVGPLPQPETLPQDLIVAGPGGDTGLLDGTPVTETILPGLVPTVASAVPTPVATGPATIPVATDPTAVTVAGVAAGIAATTTKIEEATKTAEVVEASEEGVQSETPDLLAPGLQKTAAEAAAKGASDAGKPASSEANASGITKSEGGEKTEAVANKSTAPNLHPSRASHFADLLEGFGASNAIHRPADILAGLDRSVAAQALNRSAEVSRPTPLQMLPIEIGMQAVRGVTNFQIRLDPAELGRVDVKLQIRENGEVNASLVVDRVETLQMLRRDASTLQNAFEQAGLKQSPDGLSFSLRGEGREGQQQEQRSQGGSADTLDEVALQAQLGDVVMRRALVPNSSIDRMV